MLIFIVLICVYAVVLLNQTMLFNVGSLLNDEELQYFETNFINVPVNADGKLSFAAFTGLIPELFHDVLIDWTDLFADIPDNWLWRPGFKL